MEIPQILKTYKKIAVVGASPNPDRTSNQVLTYLKKHGYRVFPINPNAAEISGQKCYPSLESVPENIEIVDIFRRSEECVPIVEAAIKIRAKVIWMQEGVVNREAEALGVNAGLTVVMDHCLMKEHKRYRGQEME